VLLRKSSTAGLHLPSTKSSDIWTCPFRFFGLPPDLCPHDGLLGVPLLAALEQMLVRLLNSAVAPPTGVAGALDLLELWPDEGVPRPQLVKARGHRFASSRRRRVWPHRLPWSIRVVLAQARLHPLARLDPLPLGDTSLQVGEGRAAELVRQLF